jgi:hypothetical protein
MRSQSATTFRGGSLEMVALLAGELTGRTPARIGAICDEFECYGYRRVGAALRYQGVGVNGKLRRLTRAQPVAEAAGVTGSLRTATTPSRSIST